ncbi:MFS transporter [Clostridium sp. 19966]|uniref:MDR family MFS transporter n=1 Tax=Clostridium sp. 19966 TaxID=2768166 RepID=UPI0028DEA1EF|nr:MFS transporter [Clostridium sp. 19966]MDT8716179.1 MFS transporter [Clostridium sp. 19966]
MRRLLNAYRGLPKGMYVIFFAQIINRFGDFVRPFLTLYLTEKVGMSTAVTGMLVTISSLIGIPSSLIGGKIADKFGRKKAYMYSQFISAAALIPCALTKNASLTVTCLIISTFFNGFIRPAFNSIMTDMLSPEQRQVGFSLQYLGINVGVSVGPIVAGFLFNNFLPLLFLGDAFTSFVALFLIWKNIEETHPKYKTGEKTNKVHEKYAAEKAEGGNIFTVLYKRPHICFFILISSVYSFAYAQAGFALPMTLRSIYGSQGAHLFGYLMSINAVTVLALTVFLTVLTRKNHPLTNTALSGVMYALGFGMLAYINHFTLFIISTIIWTSGEILGSISSGVYVANNSPSNYRARLSAVSSIGGAIGSALSASISGAYMQAHGSNSIWKLTFLVTLIAAMLMFVLKIFSKRMDKKLRNQESAI